MGLVELYLETGKPIGSQTLKDGGFDHMSSATLRNYFAHLESEGYLRQAHISGGRLPTDKALSLYADWVLKEQEGNGDEILHDPILRQSPKSEAELSTWMESVGAELAQSTHCAIVLPLPRFAQDYATRIQLVHLHAGRLLAIICTQHGLVHTLSLQVKEILTRELIELAQRFCNMRLNTHSVHLAMTLQEERFCSQLHSEIMIRYFIENSPSGQRDLPVIGLSEILHHPEGGNAAVFAEFVSLFENRAGLQSILNTLQGRQGIHFWIGDALRFLFPAANHCAIVGTAYQMHRTNVGAFALIGPSRLPYRQIFEQLKRARDVLSRQLTQCVHKFNLEMRSGAKNKSSNLPQLRNDGKNLLQLVAPKNCKQESS